MKKCCIIILLLTFDLLKFSTAEDPFSLLGIPSLDPSALFNEETIPFPQTPVTHNSSPSTFPVLKSIEDLPTFLRGASSINEKEGIAILSRFLIADDMQMKHLGAVFDQTGYDGLNKEEILYPEGTKERLSQLARSAAKVFYKTTYEPNDYEPYGAEELYHPEAKKDWKVFRVLLIGKANVNDHVFVRVCVPESEMLPPIVNQQDVDCTKKIGSIEEGRKKNEAYLNKIKQANYFQQNPNLVKKSHDEKKIKSPPQNIEMSKKKIQAPPNVIKLTENQALSSENMLNFMQTKESRPFNLRRPEQFQMNPQQFAAFQSSLHMANNLLPPQVELPPQNSNPQLQQPQKSVNYIPDISQYMIPKSQTMLKTEDSSKVINSLEQKVEKISEKISKLESRVEKEESQNAVNSAGIFDIKSSLDKNFSKLDAVLENLVKKIK